MACTKFGIELCDVVVQIVPEVHKTRWQAFIEELGLCPLRHAKDYWSHESVCRHVLEYARRSGAPSLFPKQDELNEVSVTQGHPLQALAKGLAVKVCRIGGLSRSITFEKLKQRHHGSIPVPAA